MTKKFETHIGSTLNEFLAEQGVLEETTAIAIKRVIAWQLAEAMKAEKVTKKAMAEFVGRGSPRRFERLRAEAAG